MRDVSTPERKPKARTLKNPRGIKPRPRICIAIDEAIEESGWTNQAIADELGTAGYNIGRWRKDVEPSREDLARLEKVLAPKRNLGWVSKMAGLFEDLNTTDIIKIIEHTHLIGEGYKAMVTGVVRSAMDGTAEDRESQEEWRKTASVKRRSRRS